LQDGQVGELGPLRRFVQHVSRLLAHIQEIETKKAEKMMLGSASEIDLYQECARLLRGDAGRK
jgi:hypothetical protein